MCDRPCMTKDGMNEWCRSEGIRTPRLYEMGFPHNNCGGFCIKTGQSQFRLLLEKLPERYAFHEAQEEAIRVDLGNVSILRDRRGGTTKPLTMKQFRERIQAGQPVSKCEEFGGCGCALDTDEDLPPEGE